MPLTGTDGTAFSRRAFLAGLGSLAAASVFSGSAFAEALLDMKAGDGAPLFASAFRHADGGYGIAILDDIGQVLARISLPGRGHGVAVSPDRSRLVAFARRPGTFALVIRPFENAPPKMIASEPGRHFYGHGCFSADGRLLYAVENDYSAARGVVGVYDASGRDIRRVGEIDTHGTGPHDLLLSSDGRTLIVANGGIETHPDRGREKLNLDTMAPSVVFLDTDSGDLRARHALDASLHQVSLRHMAQDAAGRVWVGGQFEGPSSETPPLIAVIAQDEAPQLARIPGVVASGLENYIGSVAASRSGEVIATTAPRGGQTLFWKAEKLEFLGAQAIADGCGAAPVDRDSFLISDGNGAFSFVAEPGEPAEVLARPPGVAWDNHLASIT